MKGLIVIVIASFTGALGWWAGAHVGIMTAFLCSITATAAGVYFTRSWIANNLE